MDFVVANAQAIAEAAKIVPLTDEQAHGGQGKLATAEGGS